MPDRLADANFDQDALIAAVDLVGRSGATSIQIGWQHDDVPTEEAGWYAQAIYLGARLIADEHRGPVEACEALARKMLHGAKCRRCGQPIALADVGGDVCRWKRQGNRWEPGCDKPIDTSIPHPFLKGHADA